MLDLGFSEILFIAVVAIIVLGPEKMPQAMVSVVKFFKKIGNFIADIKDNVDRELHIQELREEANRYKSDLLQPSKELESFASLNDMKLIENDVETNSPPHLQTAKQEIAEKKTQTSQDKIETSEPHLKSQENGGAKAELESILQKGDEKQ
jgi:sec-independent protein translocase protein TatB